MVLERIANRFDSCEVDLEIAGHKISIRVLKMIGSTMLFIGNSGAESIEDLAMAMQCGNEVISTPLCGENMSEAQRLSLLLSKRFKIQFFVSYNTNLDKNENKVFVDALFKIIEEHKDKFIQEISTC